MVQEEPPESFHSQLPLRLSTSVTAMAWVTELSRSTIAELPTIVATVLPVLDELATSSLIPVRVGDAAVLRKGLRLAAISSEPLRVALALVVREVAVVP